MKLLILILFTLTSCVAYVTEDQCNYKIDSLQNCIDSLMLHDPTVRDSVVIVDTIRLIETGRGNLYISGAKQYVTFDIDLDSIKVLIRNDSLIDKWQRPALKE